MNVSFSERANQCIECNSVRSVSELLALHSVCRAMSYLVPDEFSEAEVYDHCSKREQRLIELFEGQRKHLLIAISEQHPEAKHAI